MSKFKRVFVNGHCLATHRTHVSGQRLVSIIILNDCVLDPTHKTNVAANGAWCANDLTQLSELNGNLETVCFFFSFKHIYFWCVWPRFFPLFFLSLGLNENQFDSDTIQHITS